MLKKTATPLQDAFNRQHHLDRFIIHLRQRFLSKQLNLALGAGATNEAGVPLWRALVNRLHHRHIPLPRPGAKNPLEKLGPAFLSQIVQRRFTRNLKKKTSNKWRHIPTDKVDQLAQLEWYREIRAELYRDVPRKLKEILDAHPYLTEVAALVSRSPLTINFNFDDLVDKAAEDFCRRSNFPNPNIVWRLPVAYLAKDSTIFHINGYLPRTGKSTSENLILTEGAFADLMVKQMDYQSVAVLRAFAESTMLLCGCSLEDSSLKAVLRSSANINFGNYHYMVSWLKTENALSRNQIDDVFDANLEVYNLITLFLRSQEIAEVARLIAINDDNEFDDELRAYNPRIRTRFHFYTVGAVGAGKTTLIRNLRSFKTYEEWMGPVPEVMYKDPPLLSDRDKEEVKTFLRVQLKKKNSVMLTAEPGFHIMDRAFLDLFAFSDDDSENLDKVHMLLDHVGPTGFQDGQIVFLKANSKALEDRQWKRGQIPRTYGGRGYSEATLEKQQKLLERIYTTRRTYDTEDIGVAPLAKRVAIDILTADYEPLSFTRRIEFIRRRRLSKHY